MSEPGDLQAPAWLQRNWTPKEPFDPTPWLQERYRRQVEQQKLPLQLQQMELQNKAQALETESRGLLNDQLNIEMDLYQQDLPALRSYMEAEAASPGAKIPYLRSKQAMAAVAARQKMDADTGLGFAVRQKQVQQAKQASDIVTYLGVEPPMGPGGLYDPEVFPALVQQAAAAKQAIEFEEKQAATAWHSQVAAANAEVANLRFERGLEQRKAEAEDRSDFRKGMLDLRRGQLGMQIEKMLQADVELKELHQAKIDLADDLRKTGEAKPGWRVFGGASKAQLDHDAESLRQRLKDTERQIEQRENRLRSQFADEAQAQDAAEAAAPHAEPSAPAAAQFEYDPVTKKLKHK